MLLRFDPGWVRYAPLTSSGNVIAAGLLAVLGQFGEQIGDPVFSESAVREHGRAACRSAAVIPLAIVAFLVLGAVFSLLGYLRRQLGLPLARDSRGRTFHVRRGLLTSTETSLERERVRGLAVDEPLGLRLAGAGRLFAIVTGVSKERGRPHPAGATGAARRSSTRPAPRCSSSPSRCTCRSSSTGPRPDAGAGPGRMLGALVLPVVAVALAVVTPVPWWVVLPTLLPSRSALVSPPTATAGSGHALTDELPRRTLRLAARPPRRRAAHRHHRLEPPAVLVPAPRRPGHPGRDDGRRARRRTPPSTSPRSWRSPSPTQAVPGLLTPFLA